jgi:hypothetical protein
MKNKNKVYVVMGQVDYENTDCLGVYSSKKDASVAINIYMKEAQKDWDTNTYNLCRYDRYYVEERFLNVPAGQVEPVLA